MKRAGIDPGAVEDVIMGNVVGAGGGQAPARQAAIRGGIPASVPAMTINKVCGSGLKAVMLASQAIKAGDLQVAVAGGFESMSNVPFYLRNYRGGVKFGDQTGSGRPDLRRSLVLLRELPHGWPRRVHGGQSRDHPGRGR